jgi:hypothetical protein
MNYVISEGFSAVTMKHAVFWVVTPCGLRHRNGYSDVNETQSHLIVTVHFVKSGEFNLNVQ